MEAICSSETSVDSQRTSWRYIPDDGILHNRRCENLISYLSSCLTSFYFTYYFLSCAFNFSVDFSPHNFTPCFFKLNQTVSYQFYILEFCISPFNIIFLTVRISLRVSALSLHWVFAFHIIITFCIIQLKPQVSFYHTQFGVYVPVIFL
jgi:hypothetical protein